MRIILYMGKNFCCEKHKWIIIKNCLVIFFCFQKFFIYLTFIQHDELSSKVGINMLHEITQWSGVRKNNPTKFIWDVVWFFVAYKYSKSQWKPYKVVVV